MLNNPFQKTKYSDLLLRCGISYVTIFKLEKCWSQPWRVYHNLEHLNDILSQIEKLAKYDDFETFTYPRLVLAAFFHDVQYLPWDGKNNEDISISIFKSCIQTSDTQLVDDVCSIIESTKSREIPTKEINRIFWLIDNSVLLRSNIIDLISYEHKIFKEFQFVDYSIYKEKRIEFLNSCIGRYNSLNNSDNIDSNLKQLISYIENRVVNIGVYAGSFNPVTIGHLNIIEKAERIFDKVIIARGVNPDKPKPEFDIPTDWRQCETYPGLISKYISSKENACTNVTSIRGLRNGDDLDYEVNQLRYIEKLNPTMKTIFINCDKEVEEISSTAVKSLLKINDDDATKLANKYIYQGIRPYINYL